MTTDGCASKYVTLIAHSGEVRPFNNSWLGICYFHVVVFGYKTQVAGSIPRKRTQYSYWKCDISIEDVAKIMVIWHWIRIGIK